MASASDDAAASPTARRKSPLDRLSEDEDLSEISGPTIKQSIDFVSNLEVVVVTVSTMKKNRLFSPLLANYSQSLPFDRCNKTRNEPNSFFLLLLLDLKVSSKSKKLEVLSRSRFEGRSFFEVEVLSKLQIARSNDGNTKGFNRPANKAGPNHWQPKAIDKSEQKRPSSMST